MTARCASCGAPATKMCASCRAASYCGRECQAAHWKGGHAKECRARKRDETPSEPSWREFVLASWARPIPMDWRRYDRERHPSKRREKHEPTGPDFLTALPAEILFAIALRLDGPALSAAAPTCRALLAAVRTSLTCRDVPASILPTKESKGSRGTNGQAVIRGRLWRFRALRARVASHAMDESAPLVETIQMPAFTPPYNFIGTLEVAIQSAVEYKNFIAIGCVYGHVALLDGAHRLVRRWRSGSDSVHSLCVFGDYLVGNESPGNRALVWDQFGTLVDTLNEHTNSVRSIVMFGDRLATGSWDKTIKLWDASRKCVATLRGHRKWVMCLCEAGERLASSDFGHTIKTWSAAGVQLSSFVASPGRSRYPGLAFSGKVLGVATDVRVSFWTLDGTCLRGLESITADCNYIDFADGRWACIRGKSLKIWDVAGRQ